MSTGITKCSLGGQSPASTPVESIVIQTQVSWPCTEIPQCILINGWIAVLLAAFSPPSNLATLTHLPLCLLVSHRLVAMPGNAQDVAKG